MENISSQEAQRQKLPIDRVAEENIYQELKAQYEGAKQTGYGYRHESDLDAIFRRQAGILAAGGVKSVYDIDTRTVDRSSVIERGTTRPDYQGRDEDIYNVIEGVRKIGEDYYYDTLNQEGLLSTTKIDPARILSVEPDIRTSIDPEFGREFTEYAGVKIRVKDTPLVELVNKRTNEPVYDVELRDEWREDPLAYKLLNKPVEVAPRRGFNRIHTNYGVRGAADLSFQMVPDAQGNQVPLILPVYRSTSTDFTPLLIAGSLLAGGLYFGPGAAAGTGATAGTGAAAGTTLATSTAIPGSFQAALPGLGVSTAATTAASTAVPGTFSAALPGLLSSTAAGAPIYFANAVPAEQLAYPSTQVGAGATPVPGSLQARLGELGVQTAATTAPATAAAGSFQAALPSLLGGGAASGPGVLDTLRTINSVRNMLTQPTVQQQAGLLSGGGGQPRGVDFSPLYQNTTVGLLPGAERYRRSLI